MGFELLSSWVRSRELWFGGVVAWRGIVLRSLTLIFSASPVLSQEFRSEDTCSMEMNFTLLWSRELWFEVVVPSVETNFSSIFDLLAS